MDRKTRFEDWLAQNIAAVVIGVFTGGVILVATAALAASAFGATQYADTSSKATGCIKPSETINYKDSFGKVQFSTFNRLYACYDGKQVRLINTDRRCNVLSSSNWAVKQRSQLTWWTRWGGSDHGALHSYLYCSYVHWPISVVHIHRSEVVIGATGWVNFP